MLWEVNMMSIGLTIGMTIRMGIFITISIITIIITTLNILYSINMHYWWGT